MRSRPPQFDTPLATRVRIYESPNGRRIHLQVDVSEGGHVWRMVFNQTMDNPPPAAVLGEAIRGVVRLLEANIAAQWGVAGVLPLDDLFGPSAGG